MKDASNPQRIAVSLSVSKTPRAIDALDEGAQDMQ
jgi:hypothetical protein